MVLLTLIGYLKKMIFHKNFDEMLNSVNFQIRCTFAHPRILDVMLRVLSNLLMAKLTDISAKSEI